MGTPIGGRPNVTMDSFLHHFEDPMSYDIMADPVIDEEGHTFDRSQILLHRDRNGNDVFVSCPISRHIILMNNLRPNRVLKDVIDDVQQITDQNQFLRTQNEVIELKKQNIELSKENERLRATVKPIEDRSDKQMEFLVALNNKVDTLVENHALADAKARLKDTQLANVINMSLFDRIISVFLPERIKDIKDSGLSVIDHGILARQPKPLPPMPTLELPKLLPAPALTQAMSSLSCSIAEISISKPTDLDEKWVV